MPSPNILFSELASTTLKKHSKQVVDQVSKNNALLSYIMKKKNKRMESGGLSIVTPLEYAQNNTYQRYSGYDTLNVSASDIITSAEYPWRQIALNVTASGLELRINSGETRIVNLVKTKIKNAIRTFKNNFSSDLYSDGTLSNQIGGLQLLVSDTGGGVVGGIDSSAWDFWRSKVQSAAAPIQGGGAVLVSPTTIEGMMLPLWMTLVRDNDKPDLIVADTNYFTHYELSQVSMKRYTSSDEADGGFVNLKYKGATIVFDGNTNIPANRMYFLNSEYIELVVHSDADLTVMDTVSPHNQDAFTTPMLWMGNVSCSNRAQQGVFKA